MCGIVGFNWEDKILLKKMSDKIIYRGPDDVAYYSEKYISLGMRRLSIIDLNKGIYPLKNEKEDILAIFNGEIYNFKELRRSLEEKGHRFKTDCDGEAIVHAYEEYGENFVSHLNGMFAIALYDWKKKILFLVRDRLGIKPLYYYASDYSSEKKFEKRFMFASEIKSILEYSEIKREINVDALNNYFSLRYNPLEETFFKGIKKLLPGYLLRVNLRSGDYSKRKYWDIADRKDSDSKRNIGYYEKQLSLLLKDSVKRMLISDVPLGVYLSGGIDSSAIVSIMHELRKEEKSNAPIRTYNVSFLHGEKVNESLYARRVSELFHTEHEEFVVEPDVFELLPKMIWHTDEPMADPALIPLYLLSQKAKKTSTVILTGDGGDELFAGYEHHRILKAAHMASKVPMFRKIAPKMSRLVPLKIWDKFHKYASDLGEEAYVRGKDVIANIRHNNAKAYYELLGVFSESEKKNILGNYYSEIDYEDINHEYFDKNYDNPNKKNSNNDFIEQLLLFDTKRMLPESFLMKTDRMTMASSIESRVPLLDHRIAELALQIPSRFKLNGINQTKYVLKRSLVGKLPKDILYRKKQSFNMPIENWLNTDLKSMVDQMLIKDNLPPMLNPEHIKKIMQNYNSGKLYYARQLWSILTFTVWYKMFVLREKNVLKDKTL